MQSIALSYVTRSAVESTWQRKSCLLFLFTACSITIFLSCVICSHHHETGCTAAAEAPEVAVSQVPVFNFATDFDYDILFECF
jgi:hypothetical protein